MPVTVTRVRHSYPVLRAHLALNESSGSGRVRCGSERSDLNRLFKPQGLAEQRKTHMRFALRLTASVGGGYASSQLHLDLTLRLRVLYRHTPPLRKTSITSKLVFRIKHKALHNQRSPPHASQF